MISIGRWTGTLILAGGVAAFTGAGLPRAFADTLVIQEVENLRNTLSANDPTRQTLTLRLADILFDEIGEISRNPSLTDAQTRQISNYRQRALSLYTETLTGGSGLYAPVKGTLRTKVQFQLARLYMDLGQTSQAKPLWKELFAQSELPHIQRESAFRLAELAEADKAPAEAEGLYRQAIALCGQTDLCSYGKYRRAWALRNMGQLDAAIEEIQQALVDSHGQVREEALRDLLMMLSGRTTDGAKELALVDQLSAKFGRARLIFDLADAFFSGGNRAAGTLALEFADNRQPDIRNRIRLLEETYGLRRWEQFHAVLDRSFAAQPAVALDAQKDPESEKILRRLTVQLDGERIGDTQRAEEFKSVVTLYLKIFPASKERMKMMEGWLAAEKDAGAKLTRLQAWLGDSTFVIPAEDQIKLHEARAALAKETHDHALVASEAAVLQGLVTDPAKKRDYQYGRARALYDAKDFAQALPLFLDLAKVSGAADSKPQKWAIESENLAIDIYGQQRNYRAVIAQADQWLTHAALAKDGSLTKELQDLKGISENAQFELAASLGQAPEALGIFKNFCVSKKLLPKSCDNAKVLAVQLRDQKSLIAVLEELGSKSELASEYERSAYFQAAAKQIEAQLGPKIELRESLKVALLYELADQNAERDRVLRRMMDTVRAKKTLSVEEEGAVYATLRDADLLDAKALSLPWSPKLKARLADRLESLGKGTSETRKILLASTESTGPAWNGLILEEVKKLDQAQKKIGFYGRQSQRKFEARLAAVKKLVKYSDTYLPGADSATRADIAQLLAESHAGLADEILKSPIPKELSEEEGAQVKQAMGKMAEPFQERSKAYETTATEQRAKATAVKVPGTELAQNPGLGKSLDLSVIRPSIEALHTDPTAKTALTEIRNFFESKGKPRLASYFQGRLAQAEEEGKGLKP